MPHSRIALVTCANLPDWEVDDAPLRTALADLGAEVVDAVWSDPEVDWSAFDLAVIRTAWDYQERLPAFLEWAERTAQVTRLEHDVSLIRWNTTKTYLRELASRGVPLAPTQWIARGSEALHALAGVATDGRRYFLKPVVGASASNTLRFGATQDGLASATAHLEALLPEHAFMLQPYLETVETEGEYSLLFVDGIPTHGVQKIPVPGDYRVQDDYGASDGPWPGDAQARALASQVLRTAQEILEQTTPFLYARVDLLRGDDGAYVLNELELVEPSMFFRHGQDAARAFARAAIDRAGQ